MKKERILKICVLLMGLVIVGLIVYILLTSTNKKNSFLNDTLNLQANLSYYIGQTKSDTFNAYDNIQIITGTTDTEEIKNYNDEVLKPIVDKNLKIEQDGKVYYKVINENVKEVLNIDLSTYSGLEFYVQDGQYLRVKVLNKPSWWDKNYNALSM